MRSASRSSQALSKAGSGFLPTQDRYKKESWRLAVNGIPAAASRTSSGARFLAGTSIGAGRDERCRRGPRQSTRSVTKLTY